MPVFSHSTDEQNEAWKTRALPERQLLMSLASSIPSGQTQVNLGEWELICGAGRQRYWQPPLGRAVLSHQFTPRAEKEERRGEDETVIRETRKF